MSLHSLLRGGRRAARSAVCKRSASGREKWVRTARHTARRAQRAQASICSGGQARGGQPASARRAPEERAEEPRQQRAAQVEPLVAVVVAIVLVAPRERDQHQPGSDASDARGASCADVDAQAHCAFKHCMAAAARQAGKLHGLCQQAPAPQQHMRAVRMQHSRTECARTHTRTCAPCIRGRRPFCSRSTAQCRCAAAAPSAAARARTRCAWHATRPPGAAGAQRRQRAGMTCESGQSSAMHAAGCCDARSERRSTGHAHTAQRLHAMPRAGCSGAARCQSCWAASHAGHGLQHNTSRAPSSASMRTHMHNGCTPCWPWFVAVQRVARVVELQAVTSTACCTTTRAVPQQRGHTRAHTHAHGCMPCRAQLLEWHR